MGQEYAQFAIDVFAYFKLIINPRGHDIFWLVSQRLATPRSVIM